MLIAPPYYQGLDRFLFEKNKDPDFSLETAQDSIAAFHKWGDLLMVWNEQLNQWSTVFLGIEAVEAQVRESLQLGPRPGKPDCYLVFFVAVGDPVDMACIVVEMKRRLQKRGSQKLPVVFHRRCGKRCVKIEAEKIDNLVGRWIDVMLKRAWAQK